MFLRGRVFLTADRKLRDAVLLSGYDTSRCDPAASSSCAGFIILSRSARPELISLPHRRLSQPRAELSRSGRQKRLSDNRRPAATEWNRYTPRHRAEWLNKIGGAITANVDRKEIRRPDTRGMGRHQFWVESPWLDTRSGSHVTVQPPRAEATVTLLGCLSRCARLGKLQSLPRGGSVERLQESRAASTCDAVRHV